MTEWEDTHEIIGPECYERFLSLENVPELAELNISIAGVSQLAGHYRIAHRKPDAHTVLYTVSGKGSLSTPNIRAAIETNSITFLPAGKPFSFEIDASEWSTAWFCIENSNLWAPLAQRDAAITYCGSSQVIYHLMCVLYYESQANYRQLPFQQLQRYLRETLLANDKKYTQYNRLEALFSEIEQQLHHPWTIDEMAAYSHYSPSHLHRLCLDLFKRSPRQQLIHLRMRRAEHLLAHSDWSLSQIASALGYQDVFNFSNRFKKSLGTSPSVYRQKHLQKTPSH